MSAKKYDVIVIGGGPNGLTTAGLLAKHGRSVLVVEQRDRCGGLAAAEEFADGYRVPGVLHDTSGIRHHLLKPLDLERHGLELQPEPPTIYAPGDGRGGLVLCHDAASASKAIAAVSHKDAESYAAFRRFIDRVRDFVNGVLDDMPLDPTTMSRGDLLRGARKVAALRRLGRRTMLELLRIGPMAVSDWLDEWFESDLIKVAMCGPAIYGSFLGPRSPGSATNLLVWECRKGPLVAGGAVAFVAALEAAVRAQGVEIATGTMVERIRVSAGKVEGVVVDGGRMIDAVRVAATCHPVQTLLRLIGSGDITETFAHRIRNYRTEGTTAKVNLALRKRIELTGGETVEIVRTGSRLDDLEKAFDPLKYGGYSARPTLDIYVPATGTPANGGLAPDGHSVMSVLANFAPYKLREEWDDGQRERVGEKVLAVLAEIAPGIADAVAHLEVLTPADIESRYALTGGHILHGDHTLDQLFSRPSPECAGYASPIEGLFLCGSGAHPGGGLTGAPGALGARAILKS